MLIDRFARMIDYLRISVTDRCNLRCLYCMPEGGILHRARQEILTLEEIEGVLREAVLLGISRIRFTGGEPLLRKGLVGFISQIVKIEGISDIALTTNGILLARFAEELKRAGLKRLNISLDTLDEAKYRLITRCGNIEDVRRGIEAALGAGFSPIKINVVVIRGLNYDEILDFAKLTKSTLLHIRFIEFMPIGDSSFWSPDRFVSMDEVKLICQKLGEMEPAGLQGSGPARYLRYKGSLGTIGFISALTKKFCYQCNRLRLTSDGKLKGCLHSGKAVDLKLALREKVADLKTLISLAIEKKPMEHNLCFKASEVSEGVMAQIGG